MSDAVAKKLAAYRDAKRIKQSELSTAMGFQDRQTLSAIENGERVLQPHELISALKFMGIAMKDFLDPTSLIGKAKFSWRQQEASNEDLDATEVKVSKIIGLFEHIQKGHNDAATPFLLKLPLTKDSTLEDAQQSAEELVIYLKLGDYPAKNLMSKVLDLGIHTLHLDLHDKVSAAAINVTKGSYIVVNRREVQSRLNFNYAHELFHILTWDALPPKRTEIAYSKKMGKKPVEEKLADAFAAALLMPEKSVLEKVRSHSGKVDEEFINHLANTFEVSSIAMKFRLYGLKQLSRSQMEAIDDEALRFNGDKVAFVTPRLFSESFVKALHLALHQGSISARKASENLDLSFNELNEVFTSYHLTPAFEL